MTSRFVHTSTHDTKDALVLQLSYILNVYSDTGTTLRELAEVVGCSASALSRIKNARKNGYSRDMVLRIADALDLNYRLLTVRENGKTVNHTEVEAAFDYCTRKGILKPIKAALAMGTFSNAQLRH